MRQLGTHSENATASSLGSQPSKGGAAFTEAAQLTEARKARIKSLPPPPPLAAFVQRVERPSPAPSRAPSPALPALPPSFAMRKSDWSELASHHFGSSVRAPQAQSRSWGSIFVLGLGAAGVLGAGFAFGLAQRSEHITTTRLATLADAAPAAHPALLTSTSRVMQPVRAGDASSAARPVRADNAAPATGSRAEPQTRALSPEQSTPALYAAARSSAVAAQTAPLRSTAFSSAQVTPAAQATAAAHPTPATTAVQASAAAQPTPATESAQATAGFAAARPTPARAAEPSAATSADAHVPARLAPPPTAAAETADSAEHAAVESADLKRAPLAAQSALAPSSAEPSVALPEQPSRDEIKRTFEALRPALEACTDNLHGTTYANVTINGSGRASYSIIEGAFAGSPQGSCMARALRTASFPRFAAASLTVRFPFVL
jgi:hypothetical protein